MEEKKRGEGVFRFVRALVRAFYPKLEVVGLENLPAEASIVVGNHAQMNGPLAAELYFPEPRVTWCAGEMMDRKTVPEYAYRDFWSQKPKWTRPFYKILARIIAPLSECIFTNAATIGVWHDARIVTTFRQTMKKLEDGANVIIFPEKDEPYNNILYAFQDRFIDAAKMYYRKSGKALAFVPVYIAPKLRKIYIGTAIRFCPDAPIEQERARIRDGLMTEITAMARALPEHTVVPYRNYSRRLWPKNTDWGEINDASRG